MKDHNKCIPKTEQIGSIIDLDTNNYLSIDGWGFFTGFTIKYCPWCGNKLKEIKK